jgi:hypothetical protein
MRKILLLLVFNLCFIFTGKAQEKKFDESVLGEKGREAFQMLLKIERFGFGGTGPAGDFSDGEYALADLVNEKKAVSALIYIVENAKPEGALYALYGLRVLKCEIFVAEFEKFISFSELPKRVYEKFEVEGLGVVEISTDAGEIQIWRGGVIQREKRLKAARDLKEGKFDKQTILKQKNKCKNR